MWITTSWAKARPRMPARISPLLDDCSRPGTICDLTTQLLNGPCTNVTALEANFTNCIVGSVQEPSVYKLTWVRSFKGLAGTTSWFWDERCKKSQTSSGVIWIAWWRKSSSHLCKSWHPKCLFRISQRPLNVIRWTILSCCSHHGHKSLWSLLNLDKWSWV